jgi:hypothetical protein
MRELYSAEKIECTCCTRGRYANGCGYRHRGVLRSSDVRGMSVGRTCVMRLVLQRPIVAELITAVSNL